MQALSGRIPLVTILPGTEDFAQPVDNAVKQTLAIKTRAEFEVEAQTPVAPFADQSAQALADLTGTATAVARSIVADGVFVNHVRLTARTAGLDADVLIYVK
jgi:hypothetical protein